MAIEDGERKPLIGARHNKAAVKRCSFHDSEEWPDHIVPLYEEKHAPPWMLSLLSASFFSSCSVHCGGNKNDCNLYCLDCTGDTLCFSCLPRHRNHRVVQIRRSSYQNVIKASEASEFIDITGVQTYIINSAKVVFLNERPPARNSKGAAFACVNCRRPLIDSHRFCSIGCKLRGMRQDLGDSITLSGETERSEVVMWSESAEMPRTAKRSAASMSVDDGRESCSIGKSAGENTADSFIQAERPIQRSQRSRRKGIPHRASF